MTETTQGEDFPHESDQADEPTSSERPAPPFQTGHARIDEAVARLDGLDDLEITEHPEEFDAIHQVLRDSLANAGRDDGDVTESA